MINKYSQLLKKHSLLLFSALISLLALGICSKSSPLYPMNDWPDIHCFFTMGKSMLDGQVLYRDLYEQKGPVLYFLFALCAMLSDTSFWSVFLMEVVSFTAFLYFSGKTVQLYCTAKLWTYLSLAALAVLVCTTPAFVHGGSAEQLCLGFTVYGLYCILRCHKEKRAFTFREAAINGVFAGMLLWIKFTMLGFYVGLCISVILWYALCLKDGKGLLRVIGQFLMGVASVTLVVLIYFICTGALEELFTAYFYNNLFLYPAQSDQSKLSQILNCLRWGLFYNPKLAIPIYIGAGWLILKIYRKPMTLISALLCFTGLVALTYWGGRGILVGYGYYDLAAAAFAPLAFAAIGELISMIPTEIVSLRVKKVALPLLLVLCVVLTPILCYMQSGNVYLMSYKKEELPQYKFAQIIRQKEDPTLLNYGFLDGGFYYAADVVPNCRYFCYFNVQAPDMWQTQWDMLWAGEFDFVVTRHYTLPESFDKYELVSTADMFLEGLDFTYYLYQLKDSVE